MHLSTLHTVLFGGLLCAMLSGNADPAATYTIQALAHTGRSDPDRQRDAGSKPAAVLTFFGAKPGMQIADLMSGGGYYAEILSYIVDAEGKVIAHNNAGYLKYGGEEAARRFDENRLSNVKRLNTELESLAFPEGQLDMVLMVMSYHDIYWEDPQYDWALTDRNRFFRGIRRGLKPGGILAIVDHAAHANTGVDAVGTLHRIDEQFARDDIERAGFKFEASSDVLRNPADDHTLEVFDEAIKGQTDRFVFRFRKIDD